MKVKGPLPPSGCSSVNLKSWPGRFIWSLMMSMIFSMQSLKSLAFCATWLQARLNRAADLPGSGLGGAVRKPQRGTGHRILDD